MNLDEYIADRLKRDPEFRRVWEESQPSFEFRRALIKARLDAGLSQAELAARIGTKQPAIARLEAGETEPRLGTLRLLAQALGVSFEISPNATVTTHPVSAPA